MRPRRASAVHVALGTAGYHLLDTGMKREELAARLPAQSFGAVRLDLVYPV